MIKILVVDDSALVRKLIGQAFSTQTDFEVRFARNGREALAAIASSRPDVVTLDVHMPEMDGLTCLDRIMIETPCPVVMVSSMTAAGADATLEALRLGAVDFVAKPTGAVSLRFDDLARPLIEKVRAAAGARLKTSLRLRERVRFRIGEGARRARTRPSEKPSSAAKGEGLVLVGTSTGGPPALEALLTGLPASFPWPIVVAQHMPATFTGPLARRLDGISRLDVQEVRDPTVLKPGNVYIGRGDADVIVSRRGAGLVAMAAPAQADYPWHPSTDRLVRSALNYMRPEPVDRHTHDGHGKRRGRGDGADPRGGRHDDSRGRGNGGRLGYAGRIGQGEWRGLRCSPPQDCSTVEEVGELMPLVRKPSSPTEMPTPDDRTISELLVDGSDDERWAAARSAPASRRAPVANAQHFRGSGGPRSARLFSRPSPGSARPKVPMSPFLIYVRTMPPSAPQHLMRCAPCRQAAAHLLPELAE